MSRGKLWTDEDYRILKEYHKFYSTRDIAIRMNRTLMAVQNKIHYLNLRVHTDTPSQLVTPLNGTITHPNSYTTVHLSGGAY